ncbi:MAG: 4'-phosphopantetheinyl transferase superfamily protein [Bacillota bacterium]
MIDVYALNVSSLDPDDKALRALVGEARATAASGFAHRSDRALCLGAGLLLNVAAREYDKDALLPLALEKSEHGKPYAPALKNFFFNLSHSGEWAVAAFGNRPLGVDIQRLRPVSPELYLRFFTREECSYILSKGGEARTSAFFELWTLKESYLKATGLGLTLALSAFSIAVGEPVRLVREGPHEPCAFALCGFCDPDYCLALAAIGEEPAEYRVHVLTLPEALAALR